MTEKEMEKLFRSKLNNREFAFNPGNWERMETILDQKASAGRWYYWRSAAAILLFGFIVGGLAVYNPSDRNDYDAVSGTDFIQEGKELPDAFGSKATEPATESNETIAYDDVQGETESSVYNQLTPSQAKAITSPDDNVATNDFEQVNDAKQNNKEATVTKEFASTESTQDVDEAAIANTSANSIRHGFEPVETLNLTTKGYNLPALAVTYPSPRFTDIIEGEQTTPLQKINTNAFFVNVGTVLSGSNTDNTLGNGLQAGIGYRRAFNNGFGVETGLNYFYLDNVNIQDRSDSVFYRFGKESIETEERNSRLDYLEVPLNLSYKIAPRHQIGLGGYAAILLNVERDITRTTFTPKGGTTVEDEKASGYLDEFNRFDFGFSAFYRYSFSPRLKVGVHLKQGLMDITHDVSEGYADDHTNFNTRLVLEYNLF